MSRAAILSASGDPFTLLLGIKLFKERFYDEVDRFYINFNNYAQVPNEVVKECLSKLAEDPKIHLIYHPLGIGHGRPIAELLNLATEDLVVLLEEDFYIFESGVVDGYFKRIESGEVDLLGSPRYAAGEVAEAVRVKYNLDYSGMGDKGMSWWPSGFYCKREDLLKTDLDFGSTKFNKGQYYPELDHTFIEDGLTDTFTWTSIQLRHMGLKSVDIPQYHASPDEIKEKERKELKWVGNPTYIHAGSLSAGWRGYLSGIQPDLSNENAILEMETRVSFWTIASDVIDGFDDFKAKYREGIANLVTQGNLDRDRIASKIKIYKELMNV